MKFWVELSSSHLMPSIHTRTEIPESVGAEQTSEVVSPVLSAFFNISLTMTMMIITIMITTTTIMHACPGSGAGSNYIHVFEFHAAISSGAH
jgi:hypothetical protein